MVKTAILWHLNRVKVQWNFLQAWQRRSIKVDLVWSSVWLALTFYDLFFTADPFFISRTFWLIVEPCMAVWYAWTAWREFTRTLSPDILTHEELTRGTE